MPDLSRSPDTLSSSAHATCSRGHIDICSWVKTGPYPEVAEAAEVHATTRPGHVVTVETREVIRYKVQVSE
jgi:hypothetical protein